VLNPEFEKSPKIPRGHEKEKPKVFSFAQGKKKRSPLPRAPRETQLNPSKPNSNPYKWFLKNWHLTFRKKRPTNP